MPKLTRSKPATDAPSQPVRGSDRNSGSLSEDAERSSENVFLPSLDRGLTLLDIEGDRGVRVVQSLVLDHLLMNEGTAYWVDVQGYATTTTLTSMSPSRRLLDRIHVARGFTAYQHYGTVCDLPAAVTASPSLIVAPAVDVHYRAEDTLAEAHAETLHARVVARLHRFAERYEVPVLVTRTGADEFTEPIETAADRRLRCEQTRMGPRFLGDEVDTLCYPLEDGLYQSTFAYWRQVLQARARQAGIPLTPQPSTPNPTIDLDGGTALSPNPVLDAWTASGGR